LKNDKVLWGEFLSGALYVEDFRRIMDELGFKDCRVITKTNITVNNAEIEKKVSGIKFIQLYIVALSLMTLKIDVKTMGRKQRI
jgi:hypothetical protein